MDNTLWRAFIGGTDALRQRVVLALPEICVVSVLGWTAPGASLRWPTTSTSCRPMPLATSPPVARGPHAEPGHGYYPTYRGNAKANPRRAASPTKTTPAS